MIVALYAGMLVCLDDCVLVALGGVYPPLCLFMCWDGGE